MLIKLVQYLISIRPIVNSIKVNLQFSLYLLPFQYQDHQKMEPQPQECSYAGDYQILTKLGDGGQANVYLARKQKELFAIKIYLPGQRRVDAFNREYDFLKKLHYRHLINVVEGFEHGKVKIAGKPIETRPLLIMQFAEGGDLFQHIKQEGRLRPQICRPLFKSLIAAIKYLDSQGIAHRDLKPENILFDKDFTLKVSDFGLSTFSEGHDGDGILYSRVGTEGYRPPEMEAGKYEGIQADIFAAGVILFIMYNGNLPFLSTKPHDKIYKLIKDRKYQKFWSLHERNKPIGFYAQGFKKLMNAFFSYEPKQRPTFEDLEKDPWLNGDEAMKKEVSSKDEMKKKDEKIKLKFKNEIMRIDDSKNRGDGSENRGDKSQFAKYYLKNLGIAVQNLPVSDKKLTWVNQKPGFLVAWLNNFVDQNMTKGKCLIECSFGDCKPKQYEFKVDEEKEINAAFTFNFDDQQQDFNIRGNIVRDSQNRVSVDWQKKDGNDFYLNDIIFKLNQQLTMIA